MYVSLKNISLTTLQQASFVAKIREDMIKQLLELNYSCSDIENFNSLSNSALPCE